MAARTPPREQVTFGVVDDDDRTETLSAVLVTRRFRPHFHETYLIGVTERGAEVFETRGGRHVSPAGSLRFLNPGEVHTGAPLEGGLWAYRCLYPSVAAMAAVARDLGLGSPPWFPDMVAPGAPLAGALRAALGSPEEPRTRLERSTRLRGILADLVAAHASFRIEQRSARREPKAVATARAYIGDNATEDFGLSDLARAAAMSPYHLVRVFKAAVGLTPFAYQTQVRLGRARHLLRQGGAVAAAAVACGFYDRSHLSRAFVASYGVSPGQYRAAYHPRAASGRRGRGS